MSVIIPCFNVSDFVEEAIKSILVQTYTNLEIWIIDDASTDDTLQKIQSFKDERIKIIAFEKNTKKIGAVNNVLQKVNGKLIAFQDADDYSAPNRIEEQVKQFIDDYSLGICFTNYCYVSSKAIVSHNISITDKELKDEFLNFRISNINKKSPTVCGTMMISHLALQKTGGYNTYFIGRVAEDIHWIYRILKQFNGISIDKVLYNYRIRKGSFTQIQSTGKNAKYAYSWQLLSKIIYTDIYKNIDLLLPQNIEFLKEVELQACEEALVEEIQNSMKQKNVYENSKSFLIGKFILGPLRVLKWSFNNLNR